MTLFLHISLLRRRSTNVSTTPRSWLRIYRSFSTSTTGGGGGGSNNNNNGRSNFDRDVLLPASRGELGGTSFGGGIPKLAARRNTANLYTGRLGAASSLKYDNNDYDDGEDDDDEQIDVDPNNPFYDRHTPTMTMITNAYQPSSSYSNGSSSRSLHRDDDSEDTDQNYVLLNADIVSPSISDDGMNTAEQELEYLDRKSVV